MISLIQFASEHKIIALWAMRELHVCWPQIRMCAYKIARIYPWLEENGGVFGTIKTFLAGKPK